MVSNGTGLASDYTVTLDQRHADGQPATPSATRSATTARPTARRPTWPPTCRPRSPPASTARTWPSAYSSTGDTTTAHVGTYAITGVVSNGTGLASDYTVTLTNGTLTVNPYAFSYTIGNDSQTYGTPANLATDLPDHDHHRRQRPEPGDRLQQHGRHRHGQRRQLRDHRRRVQRHAAWPSDYTVTLTNGTLTVNPARSPSPPTTRPRSTAR